MRNDRASRHLDDMLEGLRYMLAHPPVMALLLLSVVPFLFGWYLNALIPAFNKDVLGGGPDDLGFLLSAMGLGAIAGSLMLAAVGDFRSKGAWLIGTCFAWAAAVVAFAASTTFLLAAATVAAYGWLSSVVGEHGLESRPALHRGGADHARPRAERGHDGPWLRAAWRHPGQLRRRVGRHAPPGSLAARGAAARLSARRRRGPALPRTAVAAIIEAHRVAARSCRVALAPSPTPSSVAVSPGTRMMKAMPDRSAVCRVVSRSDR